MTQQFKTNGVQPNGFDPNHFCLICKEKINGRFEIQIKDAKVDNVIHSSICWDCYNSLVGQHYETKNFKVSRILYKTNLRLGRTRI